MHKNRRRRGLSGILLNEMINKALGLYNVKKIKIVCWCENTGALILYKKFDFKPYDMVIKEFQTAKVPVLFMEKTIKWTNWFSSGFVMYTGENLIPLPSFWYTSVKKLSCSFMWNTANIRSPVILIQLNIKYVD